MGAQLVWGPDGLIPAIAQDVRTGQVLMQAYMNEEALQRTLSTGMAWYWSRSRRELWNKGATSGHVQRVVEVRADCDGDSLLIFVEQTGPACHTGEDSCFFCRVPGSPVAPKAAAAEIGRVLSEVYEVIADRKQHPIVGSYTNRLLAGGPDMYCKKIGEEATEVVLAVKNADGGNLAFEVADLLFHTMVALADVGVPLQAVAEELKSRQGKRRHGVGQ